MTCTHGSTVARIGRNPYGGGSSRSRAVTSCDRWVLLRWKTKLFSEHSSAYSTPSMRKNPLGSLMGFGLHEGSMMRWMRWMRWLAISTTRVNWILDADIRGFFDAVSQEWLIRFQEHRIGDERVICLVRKWLKAGVLEEEEWSVSEMGTPQGAVVSPLLANVYLHYVFDLWADQWRRRQATGKVIIVRYADDCVVGFKHRVDS